MGFFFFLLVIGAIIYGSIKTTQAARDKWRAAAESLNLSYEEGSLGSVGSISGFMHGHAVHITTFTRGSGKSSQTYTRYTVSYREPLPFSFTISRQKARHSIGKVFGMQDIEIGDAVFDGQAWVRGDDSGRIRQFLNQGLREDILHLFSLYSEMDITSDRVQVEKRGKDTDPATLIQCVRKLVSFCNEVSDPPNIADISEPEPPVVEPPSQNPVIILPTPSLPEVDETPPEEVIPEVKEEQPEQIPEPAEPETLIKVTDEKPLEELPKVQDAEPDVPLEIQGVVDELFGGESGGTLQQSKLFNKKFKDRMVNGSGTLMRVDKFSYDMVFMNCTGVKATIKICDVEDSYSTFKVAAVVKYPAEVYETLNAKVGTSLPISGKLVALDALMHHVYVEER